MGLEAATGQKPRHSPQKNKPRGVEKSRTERWEPTEAAPIATSAETALPVGPRSPRGSRKRAAPNPSSMPISPKKSAAWAGTPKSAARPQIAQRAAIMPATKRPPLAPS